MRFRGVADQNIHFGWSEIARIYLNELLAACLVDSGFMLSFAPPMDAATDHRKRPLNEFAHRVAIAGSQHIVIWLRLLQHHPHALDVIARVAPVTSGIEVADEKPLLQTGFDCGDG